MCIYSDRKNNIALVGLSEGTIGGEEGKNMLETKNIEIIHLNMKIK
jgi:hypothetical protein